MMGRKRLFRRLFPEDGWIRILLRSACSIYFAVTVPLRLAFVPEFRLSADYVGFVLLDMVSTLFCATDLIAAARQRYRGARVLPAEASYERPVRNRGVDSREANAESIILPGSSINGWLPRGRSVSWNLAFATCAIVPLEYIAVGTNMGTEVTMYMFNRIFLIAFLPAFLSDISKALEKQSLLKNVGLQRTWKLFVAMALAGHWCGCVFFLIAKTEALMGNTHTWPEVIGLFRVDPHADGSNGSSGIVMIKSVSQCYIQSLYWAYITMVTTGFGDIVPLSLPETIWCIITMYIGVGLATCAIANLQLVVTNMDAALTNFQQKLESIKLYMRYRRLPPALSTRIVSFYNYQWDLLRGADEEKFLAELPASLQQQVSNFMCRDLISSLPVLRKANNALLNALTDCTESHMYSPNDDIIRPGENFRGALLVSRGEVEVLRGNTVERKMQRFDRFAEESLFTTKTSEHWVRSKTFCEVYLLPADNFQQIVNAQCDVSHVAQMRETARAIEKSSSKANKMFGSAEDAIPISGLQENFQPGSTFRMTWDYTMLTGVVYYVFSIPLSIMKCLQEVSFADDAIMLSLGYLVDILFLVDALLNFNFFMFVKEGIVVSSNDQIRERFLENCNVPQELVASLPIDFLAIIFGSKYCNLLRLTKIARFPKLFKYVGHVERTLAEMKVVMDQSFRRVVKLNFVMLVVCHWVGCLWYFCADVSMSLGYKTNWRAADEGDATLSISHTDLGGGGGYLRSVYWAIVGMSTVGYGDIVPTNDLETTFATITILFGGLVLPAVVGGLAAYMGNLNMATKTHQSKIGKVRSYLRKKNTEPFLVDKVLRYYDYLWSRQGGVEEEAIMDELPGPLRQRVATYVNGQAIGSIPFFSSCDDGIKEHIVSILRPRVFLPLDVIMHGGEVGKEMYLIERGQVAVSSRDKSVTYTVLGKGDYFGESCLLHATVRMGTVYSLTYCDCFELRKEDFREVMASYSPEMSDMITHEVAKTVQRKSNEFGCIDRNFICHRKSLQRTGGCTVMVPQGAKRSSARRATFHPESTFRQMWNALILVGILYNAWTIPFRLAFSSSLSYYGIDWTFDALFLADAFLNCFEFSYMCEGELICDKDRVKSHYLRGRFPVDVISTCPVEVLAILAFRTEPSLAVIAAALRLPRLLRLGRVMKILGDIFRMFEDKHVRLAPLRLVQLLSGVVLMAHWAGCGFYAFARWRNSEEQCEGLDRSHEVIDWGNEYAQCFWVETWIQKQIINGKLPVAGGDTWQLYIRAFNWALPTLVVVVIGDVIPVNCTETLYAFTWMVVGVTINATIIGNVANLVANLETESSIFVKKTDDIKHYMHLHKVPHAVQDKVEHFMTYLWTVHSGASNEEEFIAELPFTLKMAITDHTRLSHIKCCPYFDFCSSEIVRALALCLKPLVFSIGDIIAHCGDMGQEMFFLNEGTVEVVSADGDTVFATLAKGAFFGETSIFFKQKRVSSVRAKTICEVFQLDKGDLDNELRQRDFDISRMLETFTSIAQSNNRRNAAIASNLSKSKSKDTKLHKLLIDPTDSADRAGNRVRRIYLPNSPFRTVWDIFCMLFTVYLAVSILYRVAFALDYTIEHLVPWLAVDFCIDAFFLVDIYFRYTSFPFLQNGVVVTDGDDIKRRYLQNGMVVDLLSSTPLEVLVVLLGREAIFFLRLVHLVRVCHLPEYFVQIDRYLNLWGIRFSAASSLLARMFFYYIMINHWCGCIWFIIHRYIERHVPHTWATTDCPWGDDMDGNNCLATWDDDLGEHNICNPGSIRRCYIRAVYFVITTISTVGYGDISPVTEIETLFQNVVVLIGACSFAGIIGAFAAYLSNSDTSGPNAFKLKLQKLQQYMKYRNFPNTLRSDIFAYHQYRWSRFQILNEREVMNILPRPLQMDLAFAVTKSVIDNTPILNKRARIVRERLAYAFTLQVCPGQSVIYNVGDIGWDIYFIASGIIQAVLPSDLSALDAAGKAASVRLKRKAESLGLLYKVGNHFGESCLLSQSGVRQETTVATILTELYLISKQDLESLWNYMEKSAREKFRTDLLTRNGNTWHTFPEDFEEEHKKLKEQAEKSAVTRTSPDSGTDRASGKRKPSVSFLGRTSSIFRVARVIGSRRAQHKGRERARLRSFSAQASLKAIAENTT